MFGVPPSGGPTSRVNAELQTQTKSIQADRGGYLGSRPALACDAAQKMGYRNVHSLIGGYKGMVAAGWPMKSGD
ncbi:MAG: hypothetical protein WAO21_06060 [Verrucomicrobiia bacterium]